MSPRVVQTINQAVRSCFQSCCSLALQKIQDDNSNVSACKLFCLIPRTILTPLVRGGRHVIKDMKKVYQKFILWEQEELVCLEDSHVAKYTKGNKEARCAAALRLVRCGELSRASRVLTSAGLAPSTADTAKKLASKHPPSVKSINLLNTPHTAAINLYEKVFYDIVRRSPRVSGVGPSGWRFENFRVLIDN